MAFTHLHVHSEYSLLDGLARVTDLVTVAKSQGFDSLALTDHGVMFGAVQFYQQALAAGIKPILGCEVYVASRTRHDREAADRRRYHLTVLAQDDCGYHNLLKLVSLAQLEGFYYKPRVDRELLAAHADGLIVLSGCPLGEVPQHIKNEEHERARETLSWYKEVFAGRFFVELQEHETEVVPGLTRALVALARELDLPLVATNDVHYARPEDVAVHEVLLCIQTGTTMNDARRMRYGSTFFLRSERQMRSLFSELPAAVDNTVAIAERCNVRLEFGRTKLPRYPVPADDSAPSFLRRLCEEGLARRYGATNLEARARLELELKVIGQMGFDDYFLIVWDLCRHARERGIWWNVRGSGAGSIVAYSLFVTNIDPLAHGLIFERFLNPSRISMPDIDLDFPDDQRDDLIRYTYERYGHDRVAQIITFGTMGARAAIRDAGRALDMPLPKVDRVARLVPAMPGKPVTIDDTLRPPGDGDNGTGELYVPELAEMVAADEDVQRLVETARGLEGMARHASTHAAGVVISDRPLTDYVPLHRPTRDRARDDEHVPPVTQYNMADIESLGLLKVDLLGLSTLTVLRRAAELVERYHDRRITLDDIPLDDPVIYDLLAEGSLVGVFQVESAGMGRMLRDMRPRRFEHVVAAVALYRPGPMEKIPEYLARMHGAHEVAYRHPALEPILAETYGVCVYQEQIIRIARDLAGYDAGEADTIRKAVSKKNKPQLLEHRSKFVAGAAANGIDRATAEALFDDIEEFARYGFNKAHAADYAVIVCQTAFFKAHYPVEYAAALLSVDRDDTERIALVGGDCHRLGIKLLRPDIDRSQAQFSVETLEEADLHDPSVSHRRGIRFGLTGIKNVGEGPVEAILAGRGDEPFADLHDFCRRVDLRGVGKRALESLIRAGALDRFGARGSLLAALDRIMAHSSSHFLAREVGQLSLFGNGHSEVSASLLYPLPPAPDPGEDQLQWEKDLLGLYVSEHPLHGARSDMAELVTTMIGSIDAAMAGQPVTIAGMVVAVRQVTTKKGKAMAFARVEDLGGSIEVTVFPDVFAASREVWAADRLVLVHGRVEMRDERAQVVAQRVEPYTPMTPEERAEHDARQAETAAERGEDARGLDGPVAAPAATPVYRLDVRLPRSADEHADVELLGSVFRLLTSYAGHDRFWIRVSNGTDTVELEFPNHTTRYCVGLVDALQQLLGEGHVEARLLGPRTVS